MTAFVAVSYFGFISLLVRISFNFASRLWFNLDVHHLRFLQRLQFPTSPHFPTDNSFPAIHHFDSIDLPIH